MKAWQESFPWTHGILRLLWPDRPARRKRWVVLAGVVPVLLGVHAGATAWIAHRLDRRVDTLEETYGPMAPGSLAPPAVADGDNAARAVRAATEMLGPDRKALAAIFPFASFREDARPGSETAKHVTALVTTNETALALLDEAARRPAANWNLHYSRGAETDVPPLLAIMDLAKLNAAAGRLALAEGRVDDVVAAVTRGTAIEGSLRQEPILIGQLIRGEANRLDVALVRALIARGRLGRDDLERLAGLLPPPDGREAIHRGLVGELKAMHDAMGHALDFRVVPWLAGRPGPSPLLAPLLWMLRPVLLDNDRAYLDFEERFIAWQRMPRPERPPTAPAFRPRFWQVIAKHTIPNLQGVVERGDLWETRQAMARIAVAIERYRVTQGHPPDALDDLVPRFLGHVPRDPFGDGGPFAYRRAGEGWHLAAADAWREIRLFVPRDPVLEWASGPEK